MCVRTEPFGCMYVCQLPLECQRHNFIASGLVRACNTLAASTPVDMPIVLLRVRWMATISLWSTEHGPQQILQHRLYPKTITRPRSLLREQFTARLVYWPQLAKHWLTIARALLLHLWPALTKMCRHKFRSHYFLGGGAAHSRHPFSICILHSIWRTIYEKNCATQTSEKRHRIEYFVDSNQVESNIHFVSFHFYGKTTNIGKYLGRSVCVLCVRGKPKPIFNQLPDWAIELRNIHFVKEIVMMLLLQQFRWQNLLHDF